MALLKFYGQSLGPRSSQSIGWWKCKRILFGSILMGHSRGMRIDVALVLFFGTHIIIIHMGDLDCISIFH